MVDCSHDNSGKNHQRQVEVARHVLKQFHDGRRSIMGLMLESHIEEGRQNWEPNKPLIYGMSITDPCLAWGDTEALLYEVADSLAARLV
jgi:3-deoxy-7-phosphoheptulonate synthase